MFSLHAAVASDGALVLWGEHPRAAAPVGIHGDEQTHPGAVDHVTLGAALGRLCPGALGTTIHASALVPTTSRGPVPSSPLLRTPGDESEDGDTTDETPSLARWSVPAVRFTASETLELLEACGDGSHPPIPGIVPDAALLVLVQLLRVAGALVLRQELVPDAAWLRRDIDAAEGNAAMLEARWSPLPGATAREAIDELARQLPDAARAFQDPVIPRLQLCERVLARHVDALVRARLTSSAALLARPCATADASLHDRWLAALTTEDASFTGPADALDRLLDELGRWQQRLRRPAQSPFRFCIRLEEPDDPGDLDDGGSWKLRFLLQVREDPSLLVDVADTWSPRGADKILLRSLAFHAGEHVLAPLGEAAHLFEPIADSLRSTRPVGCELDTAQAHAFLATVAPVLEQAGFGVLIPSWWRTRGGRFKLSMRAQLHTAFSGGRRTLDSLNLATLVEYDWRLAIGDEPLSHDELTRLAAQKSSLVRVRGAWIELDPEELRIALAHLDRLASESAAPTRPGGHRASVGELVTMSVGAVPHVSGIPVGGVIDADGADLAERLARAAREELPEQVSLPAGLRATLRPYQLRGFGWLVTMSQLGLGACLADDMGLGKSVQALAAIQYAWEQDADARLPSLIVAPTTVLTNWLRESERFTPQLPVVIHHGSDRARRERLLEQAAGVAIIITSYALLARDVDELQQIEWGSVILDEAQNIKNPSTRHAIAARSLRAPTRVALTGTPVENHVGDLWSIMQFLNPGLLGTQADFRRRYMLPIQSGSVPEAVEQLRRITAPFVLRREKSDRAVISDLPDKFEATTFCTLTTEQASLYEAIVREAEQTLRMPRRQASMSGIERRGLILATISRLKQACNHPAQLLGDNSPIAGRSGKLARLEELLETVLEQGERALVFTQFVMMGTLLQQQLRDTFGREVLFLHGACSRRERDHIVERFQDPGGGAPPVLVLSLKAGGSGLNLTAATHVFHFDRWWNPATEQQATDRAFRIGQQRDVQVHALVCAGTVEERIDLMLTQKRDVASSVVGSGEQWIGELDDDELIDLLQLRHDTLLQDGRLDSLDKEWRRASL